MMTAIAGLFVLLVVFAAFLFLARWVLRWALKLVLVGAVVFTLFAAGGFSAWWGGWFDSSSSPRAQRPISQSNQQRNSNRKPSPR